MDDPPTISILLLGDSECGKSTFLSYVPYLSVLCKLAAYQCLHRRLSQGKDGKRTKVTDLPPLRDLDQPFVYEIRLYNRYYRFEFSDTASPEHYALLKPDVVILCFDINDRRTLINVQQVWRKDVIRNYAHSREDIPVMLLGLKRDLRVEDEKTIYPQEVNSSG